jgi:hypothetical protein
MAEKYIEEELDPIIFENIERYTGIFLPAFGVGRDIWLNEVYPIIQNNLPSIFFRNPRVFLKPRNKTFITKKRDPISGKMKEVQVESQKSAKTQENILNYLITQKHVDYKNQVRKVLTDALLFPYGVLWHGYKGNFGMTEEQGIYIENEKIFTKRISPRNFLKDPKVSIDNLDEAKWVGRSFDIPMVDLVEDDDLDVDKDLIKGFQGFGNIVGTASTNRMNIGKQGNDSTTPTRIRKDLLSFTDEKFQKSKHARFARIYEIFLRPTKKEKKKGSKGWILLLTDEQKKPLRENDWDIKAEGFPVRLLEFIPIPDAMMGLDDISTYKSIADQKNIVINQQLENAQETGKVWVGMSKEGANEEDIDAVRDGNNTIVTFESGNPRDRMFVASGGGQASSELYLLDGRIQQNLEDKSGVTDLKRGFLRSGEESATSVKLRAAGGGARPAYRQDIMAEFLKESLLYLNQLNKQFMTIKDAVRVIGSLDLEWSENPTKEELQADVDVDLDVISMLPENPQEELRTLNETLGLMVQAVTIPEIRAKLLQEGKTINLTPIIEQILLRQKINNPDVFRNIEPDDIGGVVSVNQLKEAQANVEATLTGQQVPFPPNENDDHTAKLQVYSSIKRILDGLGQINQTLDALIQAQAALAQAFQEKQAKGGQAAPNLQRPSVRSV